MACGGGRTDESTPETTTSPGVQPDPSAERRFITLTGCLQRGVSPGEYVLASVATAGVTDPLSTTEAQRGAAAPDPEAQAQLAAASSYRLVPMSDEDLAEHVDTRVTVRGRLAAEAPSQPMDEAGRAGTPAGSTPTSATVTAEAPALRGLYVESLRKVADDCSAD
jgi:hypothetical protein